MRTDSIASPPQEKRRTRGSLVKRVVMIVGSLPILGALLFLPAGHLDWEWAWAFLGAHLVMFTIMALIIDDSLMDERARMTTRDTKGWDNLVSPLAGLFLMGAWVVAGLEERFGWPPDLSVLPHAAGLLLVVLGLLLFYWAMLSNAYFSRVVRIQEDRGHAVATGGPYRFVRHPGYVGFSVYALASALALGSLWALIPAGLTVVMLVIRTALEDRTLQAELPGYRDYAQRTRFRLLPGVW